MSVATDHFASRGAVYRRPRNGESPRKPVDGLPRWLEGIVDTGGIAAPVRYADGRNNDWGCSPAEIRHL
ncbi:MAG: hypothetical protein ABI193_07590 [Minicystis sp.]